MALPSGFAQTLYKYRDENGQWQFSDRPPPDAGVEVETQALEPRFRRPELALERRDIELGVQVVARNDYACEVQLVLRLEDTDNISPETPRELDVVLPPLAATPVLTIRAADQEQPFSYRVAYAYAPGDPAAQHDADEAYRVPFAIGESYPVSQAFPTRVTHADPGSEHAVDIALPVGTAIYAARAGTVIEIAYDSYSGGTRASDLQKANLVRVHHDDGTLGVYAHLAWNSIRVAPGQRIARGEYIADSGNTGFSSGPHLHFAVQRNTGLAYSSVPVTFVGPAQRIVVPRTGDTLTAF